MRKSLSFLVNAIAVPIIILNFFGGIVSAIWLIFIGEWSTLITGLMYMLLGTFVISLLLMITLIFAAPFAKFLETKNYTGIAIFGFLSLGTTYAIILSTSYFIFSALASNYTNTMLHPLLLWSFAAATTPWTYMASKERDNESTQLTQFVGQSVTLLIIVLIGFFSFTYQSAFNYGAYLMLALLIYNVLGLMTTVKNGGDTLIWTGGFESSEYDDEEIQFYVMTVIWFATLDNKLKKAEIVSIQNGFKVITGESISKKMIRTVYDNMLKNGTSYEDIVDATSAVSDKMKHIILKGAYSTARADSKFDEIEKKYLKELAKSMGITSKEALDILK